jgi:hypothetical protein
MGCSSGPDVVEDGLVLCLDAGSKRSYPGTGTTWTDTVGANDGTLTNMDASNFSDDNGGSLTFDGTDEDIDVSIQDIAGFEFGSISIWFNLDTSKTTNHLFYYGIPSDIYKSLAIVIGQATNSVNDESCYFGLINGADFDGGKKYLAVVRKGHTFYQDSKWHNIVCTVGSTGCSIFMDGVKQSLYFLFSSSSSATGFTNIDNATSARVGARDLTGYNNNYSSGKISNVLIYNRALTADEVRRNYLSTKERYQ